MTASRIYVASSWRNPDQPELVRAAPMTDNPADTPDSLRAFCNRVETAQGGEQVTAQEALAQLQVMANGEPIPGAYWIPGHWAPQFGRTILALAMFDYAKPLCRAAFDPNSQRWENDGAHRGAPLWFIEVDWMDAPAPNANRLDGICA